MAWVLKENGWIWDPNATDTMVFVDIGGTAGNDRIVAGNTNNRVNLFGGDDYCIGGIKADFVDGVDGNDAIYGNAGNDVLTGGAGNDWVFGDDGNDTVYGSLGNDQLHGGAGDDLISDSQGDNQFFGDAGNDRIVAGGTSASISGGDGNDTIESTTKSWIWADAGNDTVKLTASNSYVDAGEGMDTVTATGDNLTLFGWGGMDTFTTKGFGIHMDGGRDNDTFNPLGRGTEIWTGGGYDRINLAAQPGGALGYWFSPANAVTDIIVHDFQAGDTIKLIWPAYSPDLVKQGFPSYDSTYGVDLSPVQTITAQGLDLGWGYGNTHVLLEGVKDYLYWDQAADVLYLRAAPVEGTNGNDVMSGTMAADVINAKGGNDIVDGLAGLDIIDGGAGGDSIYGGDDADSINGGADYDRVDGGMGNDTIYGDATYELDGAGGTVPTSGDYLLGGNGDDVIYGDLGVLSGYRYWRESDFGGNDYIDGGIGNDKLYAQGGNDSIFGGDGNDTVSGGLGDDYLAGDAGDDRIEAGIGIDHAWGGTGNNTYILGYGAPVSYNALTVIHDFHVGDRLSDATGYGAPPGTQTYGNTYAQLVQPDGLHMVEYTQTLLGTFTHEVVLQGVYQTLTYDTTAGYYHL